MHLSVEHLVHMTVTPTLIHTAILSPKNSSRASFPILILRLSSHCYKRNEEANAKAIVLDRYQN
jgi:hypothetical protein